MRHKKRKEELEGAAANSTTRKEMLDENNEKDEAEAETGLTTKILYSMIDNLSIR